MQTVAQVFPEKRQVPLEGLYLQEKLREMTANLGRSLVLSNFVTDRNGVVAKADEQGKFRVPEEIKNSSDWGRFQELMAQSEVTISGGSYFQRLAGKGSQDILYQFEPGEDFGKLGQWRLEAGYSKRSPDLAIVTRDLDFELPERLRSSGRRIVIFTSDAVAKSERARSLTNTDITVVGSGAAAVEGRLMIDMLSKDMGYRVIMMVSGPHILDLLLKASCLDRLYVTRTDVEIPFEDPSTVQTLLLGGRQIEDLKNFRLAHQFVQKDVVTESGSHISQSFLRYDRKDL